VVAYGLDIALAIMLSLVLLKLWILPRYHGVGLQVLQRLQGTGLRLSADALAQLPDDQRVALLKLIGAFQWVIMSVIFLYFFFSEISAGGSSLGKRIFRLRIVSIQTLGPLSVSLACLRTFISTLCLTLFFPFLFINFFVGLFRRDRRCLHDLMTKSWVIRY
jgi:uncharacterized RDD family membrane protein YckC